jgi:hypothetical protein
MLVSVAMTSKLCEESVKLYHINDCSHKYFVIASCSDVFPIVFISSSTTFVLIHCTSIIVYIFWPSGSHHICTFTVGCTAHPITSVYDGYILCCWFDKKFSFCGYAYFVLCYSGMSVVADIVSHRWRVCTCAAVRVVILLFCIGFLVLGCVTFVCDPVFLCMCVCFLQVEFSVVLFVLCCWMSLC